LDSAQCVDAENGKIGDDRPLFSSYAWKCVKKGKYWHFSKNTKMAENLKIADRKKIYSWIL
jgi:hypothetical protein